MSVRLRLTLWYTGILAFTLLLFGVALYFFFSEKIYSDAKNTLINQANTVNRGIVVVSLPDPDAGVFVQLPNLTNYRSQGIFLQSYTFQNQQWNHSGNLPGPLPYSKELMEKARNMKPSFQSVGVGKEKLLIYYTPMAYKHYVIGVLQVAMETSWIGNFLGSLRFILVILAFVTVGIAATLGWFLARKSLKPIEQVIVSANQIQGGPDLGRRLAYDGPPDEIGRLIMTINKMLSRIQSVYSALEEAYAAQRRFVSDASHELRTPLTTIRGNVELLRRVWSGDRRRPLEGGAPPEPQAELVSDAVKDIADEAERMSRLVNDLLALARADAGFEMQMESVKVRPMVDEVLRRASFLPKQAEWQVGDLSEADGAEVLGNKDYLQQMLFILIENAFKYTEEGYVRFDCLRSGENVGFRIQDTGIGMEKEEIPHIFDRFYRADVSRGRTSGTGLGLSIAKWIIDEHKGSVEVASKLSEGTAFIVWIPMSAHLASHGE